MKQHFFKLLLLCAPLFAATSCDKDGVASQSNTYNTGVEFTPTTTDVTSRVTESVFEAGDVAMFDAYTADGDLYADNISYTYNNSKFTSSTPILYSEVAQSLRFVACYPKNQELAESFTFTASEDQSAEGSRESNDLLVASVELCSDLNPSIQFTHVMSQVVVTIDSASMYDGITIHAKNSLLCNATSMRFSATGSLAQITPYDLGNNQYMVFVAPQTIAQGDKFITATIGDTNYSWSSNATTDLTSGTTYQISCTLSEDTTPDLPTDTYNTGWAELPNEIVDEGNYYYAHHTVTLNGATVRNFSACYSSDYTCPVWVAGPMHTCYSQGTGSRSDNYKSDPQISCYQVETLGSPYNRGHMIASSDRLGNQEMNNQAFYLSNISPQLISGFNTGGGIWNNYEDEIQEWYENRTDTLYIVNGCNWENTNTVVSGTTVPTHYYKAVLRCKTKNSTKSVFECSSDELECVAFYFEHKSQAGVKPSSSHMISIEELEAKTGFTYFSNVPNAPKSSFSASDWL